MFIKRDKAFEITLRLLNSYLIFNSNLYKYYNILINFRYNRIENVIIKKIYLIMSIVIK